MKGDLTKITEMPEDSHRGGNGEVGSPGMSRRRMLAGTAGLALGGTVAGPALAQHGPIRVAEHGRATLGSRIYTTNPAAHPSLADIAENPVNVPPPIARRSPETVRVELETVEVEAHLSTDAVYRFWTFNGKVPGPFVRVRVGDTVDVTLRNPEDSWMMHNVDFHAATGPGGGAEATTAAPGEERSFSFKALNPGLYVYHCAVPPVALHS